MEEIPKFQILYTEEALEFLRSLSEKVQDKIVYNINKCRFYTDNELFKNLKIQKSGSLELFITKFLIDFLHFGIMMSRHLLLLHMALSRKLKRLPVKK